VAQVELVVDCRNTVSEGLVWDAQAELLYWTDIQERRLWTLEPDSGHVATMEVPERIGCLAPRARGGLVVAFASGFAFYDPKTGKREDIAPFEPDLSHTRLNDGRTDRQGRFVAGGYDEVESKPISSVVRLDPDLSITTLFNNVGCANGTCFSPDGRTMYFADSVTREISAIDYNPSSGALGARHRLTNLGDQPGWPDGSCVDEEGFIWNARWEGRRVVRYAPDGRVDRIIETPVLNPSCVTFGGADLSTLYITTARFLLTAEQVAAEPLLGGLFACRPGVRGVPDAPFAG
jgi:L-arabinonolactonase